MPSRDNKIGESAGFTVIEMLVVISVMGILVGLMALNLAGNRSDRNLDIAQNQLVTRLHQAQGYTLAARLVSGADSGQYFILKFDAAQPRFYQLQAIYNLFSTSSPPRLTDMETYQLPEGVRLATAPLTVVRNVAPANSSYACGLASFKAPYAKFFVTSPVSGSCSFGNFSGDAYENMLNHVVNVDNYSTSADSVAIITLTDTPGLKQRRVMIRGVTGAICPTQDGVNCSN